MSSFLMIYIDENTQLDPDVMMKAISAIDHANIGLAKEEYSEGFGTYTFENESTNINIGKDWEYIAAESMNKAGFHFAFMLNQKLNTELTVTDSDYSFLCKMNQISSFEEFNNIANQGIYMAEQ